MTALVIACRRALDRMLTGITHRGEVERACQRCSVAVVVTEPGQAAEARAKQEGRKCWLLCVACAQEIAVLQAKTGGSVAAEVSELAGEALARSPAARERWETFTKAVRDAAKDREK